MSECKFKLKKHLTLNRPTSQRTIIKDINIYVNIGIFRRTKHYTNNKFQIHQNACKIWNGYTSTFQHFQTLFSVHLYEWSKLPIK